MCAMVLLCAGAAQADTIDPVIIVRGGKGTISLTSPSVTLAFQGEEGCANSTTTPEQYAGVPGGMPIMTCVFSNESPAPFANLVITFGAAQGPLTVDCIGICSSFSGLNDNTATFVFDPPIPNVPIEFLSNEFPSNEFSDFEFEITFVAFDPATTFIGTFNVPEPGTLALLGTGLLAIATRLRKKRV